MTATVTSASRGQGGESSWALFKGWIVGFLIILGVLAIGATLWLHFHP